jgi:hypothetical protein
VQKKQQRLEMAALQSGGIAKQRSRYIESDRDSDGNDNSSSSNGIKRY